MYSCPSGTDNMEKGTVGAGQLRWVECTDADAALQISVKKRRRSRDVKGLNTRLIFLPLLVPLLNNTCSCDKRYSSLGVLWPGN